jgi:hypothetical protein
LEEQAASSSWVSFAVFLEFVELLLIFFPGSLGALAVEGHQGELFRKVTRYCGVGDGGFDPCGFDGSLAFCGTTFSSGAIEIADGGEIGAAGADRIQTPGFFERPSEY